MAACSGDSSQAGSVAAASPVSASAWQRQPPKSTSLQRAGAAGLGHPVGAAEALEGRALLPDPAQRSWSRTMANSRPGMLAAAWQGSTLPCGVTLRMRAAPAAHAGLGALGLVVGDHVVDGEPAAQLARAAARRSRSPPRAARGSASARRGCAAPSRSTARAPPRAGARRARARASIIASSWSRFCRCTTALMVSGRPAARTSAADAQLLRVAAAIAADAVGGRGLGAPGAELDVVEPGRRQGARSAPRRAARRR